MLLRTGTPFQFHLKSTKNFQSFKSGVKEFILNRCRDVYSKKKIQIKNVDIKPRITL
jgi:hypothetical protein